jgi:hypothetical protein
MESSIEIRSSSPFSSQKSEEVMEVGLAELIMVRRAGSARRSRNPPFLLATKLEI